MRRRTSPEPRLARQYGRRSHERAITNRGKRDLTSSHIEEEENDWFPKVRSALGRKELQEIGARLIEARAKAPRRPEQPGALKKAADAILS
jgi:hemerythrin-like domain-containing protein